MDNTLRVIVVGSKAIKKSPAHNGQDFFVKKLFDTNNYTFFLAAA